MKDTDANAPSPATTRTGVLYGVGAYVWWGMVPIYFKAIAHVQPLEVLTHRIVWSVLLLFGMIKLSGRMANVMRILRDRQTMLLLTGSTLLLACNWLTFIYAVISEQILQASLGYFINPLVNIALGYLVLGERMRRPQLISVSLATLGVGYLTYVGGVFPWISLAVAFSFGFYGLLRKIARADALVGLTVETTLLTPAAIAYFAFLSAKGTAAFGEGWKISFLLFLGGAITTIPLLWFANAARRLRLSTVGILQYIAPSMQFLLAVLFYGEPFEDHHVVSFSLIWSALLLYSADAYHGMRRRSPLPLTPAQRRT